MGIRITMEHKIEDLERRVFLLEGAVEDLLDIYKENKNDKEKKLPRKQSKKKEDSSKKTKSKSES